MAWLKVHVHISFSSAYQLWHCLTIGKVIQHALPGETKPFFRLFFFYSNFTGLHLLRKQMSTRASTRQSAAACGWDHLFWQKQAVT